MGGIQDVMSKTEKKCIEDGVKLKKHTISLGWEKRTQNAGDRRVPTL